VTDALLYRDRVRDDWEFFFFRFMVLVLVGGGFLSFDVCMISCVCHLLYSTVHPSHPAPAAPATPGGERTGGRGWNKREGNAVITFFFFSFLFGRVGGGDR